MKALMELQPYCEECPYFDPVMHDSNGMPGEIAFADGREYHFRANP